VCVSSRKLQGSWECSGGNVTVYLVSECILHMQLKSELQKGAGLDLTLVLFSGR